MKNRPLLILLAALLLITTACIQENKHIKNAKFYGYVNPAANPEAAHIEIDINEINDLFNQLKRSKTYIPKGVSQYLTLQTGNEIDVTLQIVPGNIMRVIKGTRITDLWYEFKDEKSIEAWNKLLKSWQRKLEAHPVHR